MDRYRRRCRLSSKPANREADSPASSPSRSFARVDHYRKGGGGRGREGLFHWGLTAYLTLPSCSCRLTLGTHQKAW